MSSYSLSNGSINDLSTSRASTEAVNDTAKVRDRSWEIVQQKTFTKWVNSKLKPQGIPEVTDLTGSFQDGVPLIQLLEIIGGESLGRYNKAPKLRLQRVENLNTALSFIKSRGVNLTNIGAEDIVDGNNKLVLGMIWTIILRFTIAEISEGDLSAKEGLLLWCQRKTQGYKDVNVKDFTFSWQDGLAFCALIHRHRPDLLDFAALEKGNKAHNLQLAFDVAEKHLNIPKLLEVEDIINIAKPDERSIMTYVAQYFHAFSSYNKVETAGRRVAKFTSVLQNLFDMQHDYEARARALLAGIDSVISQWDSNPVSNETSYQEAHEQLSNLINFKRTDKRTWATEKRALDSLLGDIQTKLRSFNLKSYTPPAECNLDALESKWASLVRQESTRRKTLSDSIKAIKEQLRLKFANLANGFNDRLNKFSSSLATLSGELKEQLESANQLSEKLPAFDAEIEELKVVEQECSAANIEDNEYTVFDVEDLVYDLGLVQLNVQKKISFLENQIVASSMSNLTPEQINQFEETFRHFDKDNSNDLSDHEFKAALAGLDIFVEESEFSKLFSKVAESGTHVTFQQFVNYMVSITEDQASAEQLKEAFRVLAGDKHFITRVDLQRVAGITPEVIEYLDGQSENGQLDYVKLIDSVF